MRPLMKTLRPPILYAYCSPTALICQGQFYMDFTKNSHNNEGRIPVQNASAAGRIASLPRFLQMAQPLRNIALKLLVGKPRILGFPPYAAGHMSAPAAAFQALFLLHAAVDCTSVRRMENPALMGVAALAQRPQAGARSAVRSAHAHHGPVALHGGRFPD